MTFRDDLMVTLHDVDCSHGAPTDDYPFGAANTATERVECIALYEDQADAVLALMKPLGPTAPTHEQVASTLEPFIHAAQAGEVDSFELTNHAARRVLALMSSLEDHITSLVHNVCCNNPTPEHAAHPLTWCRLIARRLIAEVPLCLPVKP